MGVYVFYRSFHFWLILVVDMVSRSEISKEFGAAQSPTSDALVLAVGYLALAYVLIFGAERLTRWTFNEPSPEITRKESE